MTSSYFTYKNKFSFNLKQEFLKRINLTNDENQYQHFKIRSLNEISKLQLLFCQQVPLINFIETNNNNENYYFSIDEIVKRILIYGNGGISSHLNLVFGLFLNEIGIKVKIIKTSLNNNSNGIYHYSNLIQWNDGKQYFVDVGLNVNSCFQPIEIGNNSPIRFNNSDYRVRKLRDGSFIYEININYVCGILYEPICHFNKDIKVTDNEICYGKPPISSSSLSLFKLFDKGYYLLDNDSFYIIYFNNSKKNSEIQLREFTTTLISLANNENNNSCCYYTKEFLNKYFNIKI